MRESHGFFFFSEKPDHGRRSAPHSNVDPATQGCMPLCNVCVEMNFLCKNAMVFLLLETPSSLCFAPHPSHPELHVTLPMGVLQYQYLQPNSRFPLVPHVQICAIASVD